MKTFISEAADKLLREDVEQYTKFINSELGGSRMFRVSNAYEAQCVVCLEAEVNSFVAMFNWLTVVSLSVQGNRIIVNEL